MKGFTLLSLQNNTMMMSVSGSLLSCTFFDFVALFCSVFMTDSENEDVPEGRDNK